MPKFNSKEIRNVFEQIQKDYINNIPLMAKEYKEKILNQFRFCLSKWFLFKFIESTDLFELHTKLCDMVYRRPHGRIWREYINR